MINLIEVKC